MRKKKNIYIDTSDAHTKRMKSIYIVGAAAGVLADELSFLPTMDLLRPLNAVIPELNQLRTVPATVPASKVAEAAHKYTRVLETGRGTKAGKAPAEAIEQFAHISDIFHNVLDAAFKIPTEKHEAFDKALRELVKEYEQ